MFETSTRPSSRLSLKLRIRTSGLNHDEVGEPDQPKTAFEFRDIYHRIRAKSSSNRRRISLDPTNFNSDNHQRSKSSSARLKAHLSPTLDRIKRSGSRGKSWILSRDEDEVDNGNTSPTFTRGHLRGLSISCPRTVASTTFMESNSDLNNPYRPTYSLEETRVEMPRSRGYGDEKSSSSDSGETIHREPFEYDSIGSGGGFFSPRGKQKECDSIYSEKSEERRNKIFDQGDPEWYSTGHEDKYRYPSSSSNSNSNSISESRVRLNHSDEEKEQEEEDDNQIELRRNPFRYQIASFDQNNSNNAANVHDWDFQFPNQDQESSPPDIPPKSPKRESYIYPLSSPSSDYHSPLQRMYRSPRVEEDIGSYGDYGEASGRSGSHGLRFDIDSNQNNSPDHRNSVASNPSSYYSPMPRRTNTIISSHLDIQLIPRPLTPRMRRSSRSGSRSGSGSGSGSAPSIPPRSPLRTSMVPDYDVQDDMRIDEEQ